jgi:hypothetical protein
MTRRNHLRLPTGWLLAAALIHLGRSVLGADEPRADARNDRMAAVVAAVRAQEAKYRDIEYVVKITTRAADRQSPDQATEVTSLETRHVVLEGDRILLRKDAHERVLATKAHREELSTYDGERTRTVVAGNCVNIHLGHFEHPDVVPAHSLPLAHYRVNLPLSVYLIDEFHLDYPACVDVPAGKGVKAWGDLFGRFAVQAIPHAVAVDGKGTIVACGRLQDVLAKASELIRKTR